MRRRLGPAIGVALSGVLLAGCGGGGSPAGSGGGGAGGATGDVPSDQCVSAHARGGLALAVGARANSPAPAGPRDGEARLPEAVEALLVRAADQRATVSVVRVDGRPSAQPPETFATKGKTGNKRDADRERWLARMRTSIAAVRAQQPEADVLAALALAGRAAGAGGTVALVDSGVQTVDPLDFRERLLDQEPADLVAYLKRKRLLPDLSGRALVLVGLGDTVAPQDPLDPAQRATVIDLWKRIGRAAGACVAVVPEPLGSDPTVDVPAVSTVPVDAAPTPALAACRDVVLPNSGSVGFRPDSAEFRDQVAATAALRTIAADILEQHYRVALIGTTATSGSEQGRLALSRERAEKVRATLVQQGVPAASITDVRGVGTRWPGHVDDVAPDGTLLPGPAARNRSVIVRVSCP